jgi:starvation-inducible DNA-binding protein
MELHNLTSAAAKDGELTKERSLNDSNDDMGLRPTRLDIPMEIRVHLIQLMNQSLTCTTDLRSQVKQAFWNVNGKESSVIRGLLKTIACELEDYADLLADRIKVMGGLVLVTTRTAASQSALPEYPVDITDAEAHVLALAERLAQWAKAIRSATAHAVDVEDMVTAAIYTEILRGIESRLSCLETYLR